MADIFISYSKPHVELTRDLASDLEAKGLTVWWDTDLLAGESFRQRIIQELHDCTAAIVIWTPQSVSSDYVISEAERARKAGKLIQIRTEEVEPIKAVGAQLGIAHRVHNVAVAQEVLERSGIDAVIGKLEAAGVAQHVRMNGKGKLCQFSGPADHFQEPGPRHRPTAFGVEDEAALQIIPPQLPKG